MDIANNTISELNDLLNFASQSIPSVRDLYHGWNMIGFTCTEPIDVVTTFSSIENNVIIVKNNNGAIYVPEFGFNGIGNLLPGYGYQIKVSDWIVNFNMCE